MDESLRLIWDAIDEGQFAPALELLQKALRKSPKSKTLWSLKGLCQANLEDYTGAIETCERIQRGNPTSQDTYQTIHDVLKGPALREASVKEYINRTMEGGFTACKRESMGRLWFTTAVRTGDLVMQRRAAVELQKGFLARHYFYLVVMSMFSLAVRSKQQEEVKLLDTLMYRMMSKAANNTEQDLQEDPRIATIEEMFLWLDILQRQERYDEMLRVLDGRLGKTYGSSLDFKQLRLNVLGKLGQTDDSVKYAQECISQGMDDWHFHRALAASRTGPQIAGTSRNDLLALVAWAAEQDRPLVEPLERYMSAFGGTLAAYEDIIQYVHKLSQADLDALMDKLALQNSTMQRPVKALFLQVNISKLRFSTHLYKCRDQTELHDFAKQCIRQYMTALSLGEELEDTDNQYGDDLLLLAVQVLLDPVSQILDGSVPLLQCAALLEYGQARAKHNYQFKLYLVRIYRLLGAWRLAEDVYKSMNIKQVQRDTLGFILYEDATFEHLSAKQLTGLKATQSPYAANCIETPDMICKAFEHGTYSKIEEFLKFQDRLENSYWRYRSDAEIMRLEMLLDKKTSAKLEQSKRVYDNRSKDIVLGCLPPDVASTWPLSFSGPSNPEGLIADADLKDLHEYQAKVQAMRDLTSSLTQNTDVAEDNKDSLLMALRDLSISGKAKNQDNLRQLFEEIVLTAEEAPHDRELLQSTGSALEKLKMAANALNGLKKSQRSALASIVQLLRNKLASLMSILESQRRRVVQSTSTLVAEVRREDLLSLLKNADESYVEQIVERVATAQTESLFALSNVAKNIRI